MMQKNCLPSLIPQAEHFKLEGKQSDGLSTDTIEVFQRDCVENLVRNIFNLSFLCKDGSFRPGVEESLHNTPLLAFYAHLSAADRISPHISISRLWLEHTLGFESSGVIYDPLQGGREVLTGVDNILALATALLSNTLSPSSVITHDDVCSVARYQHINAARVKYLNHLCVLLTSSTMTVKYPGPSSILNYGDVTLKFNKEKVTLYITTEHVCTRHRDEFAH